MRATSWGTQPLLQATKGRKEPGSPRRRRFRALLATAACAALLLVAAAAAGGRRLLPGGSGGSTSEASADVGGGAAEPWTVRGLEEAYKGLAAGTDPAAALAGSESLEAARERARKAAALPPAEFRSHAAGLTLAPGAAAAAARCGGALCDRVKSFVLAAGEAARLLESGGCAVQACPDALGMGQLPLPYTPHAFGNRCEPLWNRGVLEAVRQLVARPDWRVLEWSHGGSTSWFLARLALLTSIEAAPGFANRTAAVAAAQFGQPFLEQRWRLHVAPPASRVLTFEAAEDAVVWRDYCGARFLPAGARFDLIAVQGFARLACLARAVELLEPQGGLLVLPQAQRAAYRGAAELVPQHWLLLTDTHALGTTLAWMSIRRPGEPAAAGGGGTTAGADAGAALAQE